MLLTKFSIKLISKWIKDCPENEICAFLLENKFNKQEVIRVKNWAKYPDTFFITNFDFERIEEYAQNIDYKISAFIHSHRLSLELSNQDYKSLKFSKYPWLIVHVTDGILESRIYEINYRKVQ
jgi:proteasome lid subunit RPN8/RPN11